jgi:hypothetical protein
MLIFYIIKNTYNSTSKSIVVDEKVSLVSEKQTKSIKTGIGHLLLGIANEIKHTEILAGIEHVLINSPLKKHLNSMHN